MTPFGIFHTLISLLAVGAGVAALVRDKYISFGNGVGKVYVLATVLTCVTGFGIFHHGGFGPAHKLGIITLVVIGVAQIAAAGRFGRASPYVETVAYSATFFFHMIPLLTETSTRLPVDAPLVSGPDAPSLQLAIGMCLVVFLVGATVQALRIRGHRVPMKSA